MAGVLFGAFVCGFFWLMYGVVWAGNIWGSIVITGVVSIVAQTGLYALGKRKPQR